MTTLETGKLKIGAAQLGPIAKDESRAEVVERLRALMAEAVFDDARRAGTPIPYAPTRAKTRCTGSTIISACMQAFTSESPVRRECSDRYEYHL